MPKTAKFAPILSLLALACSREPSEAEDVRTVEGKLSLRSYRVDNPVVIAETVDGHRYFSPIRYTGEFRLSLPVGETMRLFLANTTVTGGYNAISQIRWPLGDAEWAKLDRGSRVVLGLIEPASCVGKSASGLAPQKYGQDESTTSSSAISWLPAQLTARRSSAK